MKSTFYLLAVGLFVIAISATFQSCEKEKQNNPLINNDYVVLAWNDLGMHCLNPTYDQLVILPPYNTIWAQVVKRGNPPTVITDGIKVKYNLVNNSYSYGKRQYGGFWDNSEQLFGAPVEIDKGLTGSGLAGEMILTGNHFQITGIPIVPVNDQDAWNPYQTVNVTVEDASGSVLITTQATVPTSDEINCTKCHGNDAFNDILTKHDQAHGTELMSNKPVLCASCHPDPALGAAGTGISYLSQAIHGFHADKDAACYDCHPGALTKCSRSLRHTADDGNCTTCHGQMADVANSIAQGRVPWVTEPKCVTCHDGVDDVDTGSELYRNATGHGNLSCPACHGSPHAMYPSREATDNYQPIQYQDFSSAVKSFGSCGYCHDSSRGGGDIGEFAEAHGGTKPEQVNACHVCHTVVPTDTAKWPHAYSWKNSN